MPNAKKSSKIKSTRPVQSTSYRIFDDVLALASTMARSRKDFGAEKLTVTGRSDPRLCSVNDGSAEFEVTCGFSIRYD